MKARRKRRKPARRPARPRPAARSRRSAPGPKLSPGKRAAAGEPAAQGSAPRTLRARDVMTRAPITVDETTTIGELCDLLQEKNINGAPVVDRAGRLVGVVAQEDIIYGAMGQLAPAAGERPEAAAEGGGRRSGKRVMAMLKERHLAEVPSPAPRPGEKPFWAEDARRNAPMEMPVSEIMTSPAISADEETPLADLCRIMWNLRIHRVPILKNGRVTGLVSSMDLCRAILEGTISIG